MLSDNRLFPVTVGIGLWQSTASTYGAAGGQSLWSIIILGSLVSVDPADHRVPHAPALLARGAGHRKPQVARRIHPSEHRLDK